MRKIAFGFTLLGCICAAVFCFAQTMKSEEVRIDQQEVTQGDAQRTIQTVQGQVSSINKRFISLIYNHDEADKREDEILLPCDPDVQLVHKQNISDIQEGDTVSVQYEELITQLKDRQDIKRKALAITFIKQGERQQSVGGHEVP